MRGPLLSISRRRLVGGCALASLAVVRNFNRAAGEAGDIHLLNRVDHPHGQYSFLPAIAAYSGGVAARDGYEIVHTTFSRLPSLLAGFEAIAAHLAEAKLPRWALCAVELRSPRSLSSEAFANFNTSYLGVLKEWGILLKDGLNPIARTNVAPVLFPPTEPSVHGFSYTTPAAASQRTFIIAGGGELPDGSTNAGDIFRRGDASPAAISAKARYVMTRMEARLRALGVHWPQVTTINVYTAHELSEALLDEMLNQAGHNSITWNYARPPIKDLEFEMDLCGVRREVVLR